MMMSNEMVPMTSATTNLFQVQTMIDLIAVVIGVFAIYYIIRLNRKLGGKLSMAVRFFNLGIASNVTALVWSTFWGHMYTVAGINFDVHHVFMDIGMIFFIISTHKLSGLIQS